jgi:hypothetical protein
MRVGVDPILPSLHYSALFLSFLLIYFIEHYHFLTTCRDNFYWTPLWRRDRTDNKTSLRKCTRRRCLEPGEEGGKVRGNLKEKKEKGTGGAPNPLAAIRGPVLIAKTSAGPETKGASHTQASDTKGTSHAQASDTKGASHTQASDTKGSSHAQLLILKKDPKGASHTQVSGPMKDAKVASATQRPRNKAGKKGTSHTQANDEHNTIPLFMYIWNVHSHVKQNVLCICS